MSRQNNIRWRDVDSKEYSRLRKNYNAKIDRQREKLIKADRRYEASQLPPKAPTLREARGAITTRREFNQELQHMQNYIDTGLKFTLDANTKKSLQATVRDFGTKLDRLERKAGSDQSAKAALPKRITAADLLKNASSKEALKESIKTYKQFLRPGAEELVDLPDTKFNIKITKWQKETMANMLGGINQARERELQAWKDTEVKYGGKSAGYTQGQVRMNSGDFEELAPMKMYSWSSTHSDIHRRLNVMFRESQPGYWEARTELARLNYIEKMKGIISDDEIGKYLIKHISSMPLSDFKRVLKGEDDLWYHIYDLETQKPNSDGYRTALETVWNEWLPDDDMDEILDSIIDKKVRKI